MATILLSAAGAAIGSGFGGTLLGVSGTVAGRAIGAAVGRSIDQRALGSGSDTVETGRVERFRISGAGYGVPIQEVWGRMRVAGEIIWASRFQETVRRSGGGKGNPRPASQAFSYSVSVAIGLCIGPAASVGRIWADGVEIPKNSLNLRFYSGGEDQFPDPKIEAVEGEGLAPSYRGICYVVIEDLPLARFGNRIPQFSFEVFRRAKVAPPGELYDVARCAKAVAIIPGSGEYALATSPVRFETFPGRVVTANIHSVQEVTDFSVSLSQLHDELPNCQSISLVVSWFGSDLRCAYSAIQPKVEQNELDSVNMPWQVSGIGRSDASRVPYFEGKPVYGGTPSDQSVIESIQASRSSGLRVMFYPFILMDQLEGNVLEDPWSDAVGQPKLPWRGRISLSKAPGLVGSPDGTIAAAAEVANFLGTADVSDFDVSEGAVTFARPNDWGYRRFILHYARLCALAGGVEAFCVGSELRGLTQIRSAATAFPMVDALRQLAEEVKSILGPQTKVSYAADWSEYFGLHAGEDVIFNLDPLWSDSNIDFIGIDNYMPISDWRSAESHADSSWNSIYDVEYLKANIGGGEGFDWYYESAEGEALQKRIPISDTNYHEDWIYRYKDLKGWWSNEHYNRIAGARSAIPTSWVPAMKPFWFTEYGCAAIDKATNNPNRFQDAKSSESSLPRDSSGDRDDTIQLQYISAVTQYWEVDSNNPKSIIYNERMVDLDNCYIWAWDARPFPDFPGISTVWSDSVNYMRGHWLNGRSTNQPLSAVVGELCSMVPLHWLDFSGIHGVVRGYSSSSSETARSKIQALTLGFSFDFFESEGRLVGRESTVSSTAEIMQGELIAQDDLSIFEVFRLASYEMPNRHRLNYLEAENDFEIRSVESFDGGESEPSVTNSEMNMLLTEAEAQAIVDRWFWDASAAQERVSLSIPKSKLTINVGDLVSISDEVYRVGSIEDREFFNLDVSRASIGSSRQGQLSISAPLRVSPVPPAPVFIAFLDLPILFEANEPQRPFVVVASDPWRGPAGIWSSSSDSGYLLNSTVDSSSVIGKIAGSLPYGPPGLWDRTSRFLVRVVGGELSSATMSDVLNGSNIAVVGDGSSGNWEVIQFCNASLVAADTYEISLLLRGLAGTNSTALSGWPEGSFFIVLDPFISRLNISQFQIGLERFYRIGLAESGYDAESVVARKASFDGIGNRPYSVCHLEAKRTEAGDVVVKWIRRTRLNGDGWQLAEVPIGEDVERYTIRVLLGTTLVRETAALDSTWTYTAAMQLEDGVAANFRISLAQDSTLFGSGPFRSVLLAP